MITLSVIWALLAIYGYIVFNTKEMQYTTLFQDICKFIYATTVFIVILSGIIAAFYLIAKYLP